MNLNEAIKTLKTAGYLVEALNWDAVFKENPAAKKTIETKKYIEKLIHKLDKK